MFLVIIDFSQRSTVGIHSVTVDYSGRSYRIGTEYTTTGRKEEATLKPGMPVYTRTCKNKNPQ